MTLFKPTILSQSCTGELYTNDEGNQADQVRRMLYKELQVLRQETRATTFEYRDIKRSIAD